MRTALLTLMALQSAEAPAGPASAARPARLERRVAAMGTTLVLAVEAADRASAIAASEAAVRAIETVEQRLSTWRDDSELTALNRSPVGGPFALSAELEADLVRVRELWLATDGAFDPAVGGLVHAYGLRTGGREPSARELADARPAAGFAALVIERGTARRTDERLVLEEGGFGKGVGLDAAAIALAKNGASSAVLDFGGQVLVLGPQGSADATFALADPDRRERGVLRIAFARGSLSTTGNSEHGIVVAGERRSHLLDPRTGVPAPDFGSLTVLAPDATTADALSTGLYVLGPERALAFAAEHAGIEVIVLERASASPAAVPRPLRARASAGLAGRVEPLVDGLELSFAPAAAPSPAPPVPPTRTEDP